MLSSDFRHSGTEGWWVGQEPTTGYVGVFPSSYVSNTEDTKQPYVLVRKTFSECLSTNNISRVHEPDFINDSVSSHEFENSSVDNHLMKENINNGLFCKYVRTISSSNVIKQQVSIILYDYTEGKILF